MTSSNKQGFSSAFDDMLAGNRKQFDSLFGGGGAAPAAGAVVQAGA